MGRYTSKINKTYAEYGDYSWDYVKRNQPKEYYDNCKIGISIKEGENEYLVEVPVEELVDIKLVKKLYDWDWNNNKTLGRWLYKFVKDKGEQINVIVSATLGTFNLNYEKPLVEGYYLQSEIGDEKIILSTEKKIHTIKSYDDFEWCRLRLLQAFSLND